MGEVGEDQYFRSEKALLQFSDATFKPPLSPLFIHIHTETTPSSSVLEITNTVPQHQQHPKNEWLPITESRNGNAYSVAFHILSSNIGFQALMLPVAFATLGWYVSYSFFLTKYVSYSYSRGNIILYRLLGIYILCGWSEYKA